MFNKLSNVFVWPCSHYRDMLNSLTSVSEHA